MKKCIYCKLEKDVNMFYKHKSTIDGVGTTCKTCVKIKAKTRYSKNPEKYKERSKKRLLLNPEYNKKYYKNNQEYFKQKNLEFRQNNPNYSQEWLKSNPNYYQEWSNKPESKQKLKLHQQNKLKDPKNRLIYSLRVRIKQGMLMVEGKKRKSLLSIIGLKSWDLFRKHMESQFTEGMSWENYGNKKDCWSIDHIKPISSAKTEEEIYKLNHYTNLQPMWHVDNVKKSNKYGS